MNKTNAARDSPIKREKAIATMEKRERVRDNNTSERIDSYDTKSEYHDADTRR